MSREKQIEEMARDMCGLGRDCHGCTSSMSYVCKAKKYAERAVDKGYCKQSEVAREIFGEIENKKRFIQDHTGNIGVVVTLQDIAELKKKYTEQN